MVVNANSKIAIVQLYRGVSNDEHKKHHTHCRNSSKVHSKIVEIEAKWIIQVSLSGQQNVWSCTRLLGSTNRTLFLRFLD